MRNAIYVFLTIFSIGFLCSCGGSGNDMGMTTEDSLRQENTSQSEALQMKDETIDEYLTDLVEIQENLNEIKAKEKYITITASNDDTETDKADQIKKDIEFIYSLMEKNRNTISALQRRLKESNKDNANLRKLIENFEAQLVQKDEEIIMLREELAAKNIRISGLKNDLQNTNEALRSKEMALDRAYYAFGTKKELVENNVISKEGGFIGLGKTTVLSDDYNEKYFTQISIENTTTITLGGMEEAELITTHAKGSYEFEMDGDTYKSIKITDPKKFWEASKYLVIQVK